MPILYLIIAILSPLPLWLLVRIVKPRVMFYQYTLVGDVKCPIRVGYLKSDGTPMDIT